MASQIDVRDSMDRGIPVLTIRYDADDMFRMESAHELGSQMVAGYEKRLAEEPANRSCIAVIESETAGSPLDRALFDLYKRVVAEKQQLLCVNYPADYIQSLASLGFPSLEGFALKSSKELAVKQLLSEEKTT
jgi:hypothetical protein